MNNMKNYEKQQALVALLGIEELESRGRDDFDGYVESAYSGDPVCCTIFLNYKGEWQITLVYNLGNPAKTQPGFKCRGSDWIPKNKWDYVHDILNRHINIINSRITGEFQYGEIQEDHQCWADDSLPAYCLFRSYEYTDIKKAWEDFNIICTYLLEVLEDYSPVTGRSDLPELIPFWTSTMALDE